MAALAALSPVPAAAQEPEQLEQLTQLLKDADANGDGKTTRAELDQHRADIFAKLDTNDDSVVTKGDVPRGPVRKAKYSEAFDKIVPKFDKNGDGVLTQEEWNEQDVDIFALLDADGDNAIDASEIPSPPAAP